MPAEIGQLTSLKELNLNDNQLTSVPAEIGQLAALRQLFLNCNQLTSVPAEIGQLTSLTELWPRRQSADEPAGGDRAAHVAGGVDERAGGDRSAQTQLFLHHNQLTSVPAEIGQLTSLTHLFLDGNQLTNVPAAIRELRAAGCHVYLDDGVTVDE